MNNTSIKATTEQCPCCAQSQGLSSTPIRILAVSPLNLECTVIECELCNTVVVLSEMHDYSFAMLFGPLVNDAPPSTFPRLVDGQFQVSDDQPFIRPTDNKNDENKPLLLQQLDKLMEPALIHPLFSYFLNRLKANAQPLLTEDGLQFTSKTVKDAYENLFGVGHSPSYLQEFVENEFNSVMVCPDSGAYLMSMRDEAGEHTNFYTTVLCETVEDSDIMPVATPVFGWALWECDYLNTLKSMSVAG